MAPVQPNRRTFFGGLSALFFGLFMEKKISASPSIPLPPPATPTLPISWCSLHETFGSATTTYYWSATTPSYSSSDNLVERPDGLGDYLGITYTITGEDVGQ
jgi:hypothetical protein